MSFIEAAATVLYTYAIFVRYLTFAMQEEAPEAIFQFLFSKVCDATLCRI